MKKDKQKKDKEQFKQFLIIILAAIGIGSVLGIVLINVFSTILSFDLSLSVQIILGILAGGGSFGIAAGATISDSLKNSEYEEYIEYDEYELEESEMLEEENLEQKVPSLSIVKGSGSNFNYKHKEGNKPKLEVVNLDKNTNKKRR